MKNTLSLILFSLLTVNSALAGTIHNRSQTKELSTTCIGIDEIGKCNLHEISLKDSNTGETKVIAKYAVKEVADPDEVFKLKDQLKKFQPFPLTHEVFEDGLTGKFTLDSIMAAHYEYTDGPGGVIMGSGCATIVVGAIIGAEVVMIVGAGTFLAGPALIALVPVTDIVTMPFRALIHKMKLRKITKKEALAFNALNVLMSENSVLTLKNSTFETLVDTLEQFK